MKKDCITLERGRDVHYRVLNPERTHHVASAEFGRKSAPVKERPPAALARILRDGMIPDHAHDQR